MADTPGLIKTRKMWTEAVAAGDTSLPHDEWYNNVFLKPKGIINSKQATEEKKG